MVQQTPINNSLPYRRQSSLGGNKVMRFGSPTDDNTALLWGTVTQVYYRKGTVDFSIAGMPAIVDNSGSDGTFSAPIPIDFYGVDNNGKPFAKTRLIQKGNKVLVAFVNGSASNPVILGVYPDSAESYELISPSLSNKINGTTQDDIEQTMNQIEVDPHHQLIYKAGNGDLAKTMQGHSFLLVSGTDKFALSDIQRTYEDIGYFYGNFGDSDDSTQSGLIDSNTPQAPEWLLVHENNTSADGTLDTHLTRFYVNHKGDVQVVLADTEDQKNLVVLQGNKTDGFTLMKSFDGNTEDSSDYVKFNIGSDHTITLSSATEKDSKLQSQTLEISSEDILVNGKSIMSIGDGTGTTITDEHIKDIINETTGVPDWDAFNDNIDSISQTVQTAINNANQAISEARNAAEKAQQAGEDAQLAGTNATNSVNDLKNHLVYYMSISPEKDVYVPGKYLILNEDVTVKNGFVKEAYIDDGVISTAKIKDAAITNAKIADLAVHTAQIADGAITNAKIGNLAVDTAQIADGAIIDAKVGHLTFNHMEGELLDASKIRVSNLQGDSIEAGTIKADKLIINNLSEISSNLGNITSGNIDAGQGNVTIDNLPADDPSMLTPDKKVKLQNTVNTLRQAVNAQNDFQNSIGAPSNTCDMLNSKMDKLSSDTLPLFRDMDSTEEYDYELINNDIEEVNAELNTLSNTAITTIGKTADGKNTIYTGAFAPSNPKIGDIWAKPSSDGSNEGTFEIYGENGWFSPTQDVYDRLQSDLSKQPKNYYQSGEPSGDIVEGSMWYKTSVDSLNNVTFDMYVYQNGEWVAYSDSAIKGLDMKINQIAQTADGKNSVYSSNTAPENPKANDIWIDTAHDNTIKVYLNGQWVSPNSNAEQITNEINEAFSKAPSVYYQSNEPIGNIVEGSTWYKTNSDNTYTMYTYKNGEWVSLLDSNINTAVTDATNSINNTIDGVKDDINNLNFGGRNLLRKSQARDDNNLYVLSGVKQLDTFLGANVYEQHGIWQGQRFRVQDLVSRNVVNTTDTYVFSTYVKITGSNLKNYTYFFNGDNTITKLDTDSNSVASVQPNVWTQISMPIKFNLLTPPSSNKFYIGWEFSQSTYDGNVYWACPKLEKGTKATDYSIAPEDTQDSLDTKLQEDISYRGVTISDDIGIKVQSGNNLISLNSDVGIDIYGNGNHNMSLDTDGNLVMRGNLVAGNISGVNIGGVTFTGDNMNLNNVLNVNGAIKSNGVTIDKAGLHLSDGDIALGASGSLIGCPPNVVPGWIQSDGSWASPQSTHDNGYKMLSINGGDTLTFTVGQVPDIRRNEIAFYDTNRSLVQYKNNNDFGTSHSITLTAPSNAKYVSFSFYTGEGKVSPNFPMYIYKSSSTTTLLMSDGTMIANNAILSGSLTSNNVNITGGSINLVKSDGSVAFSVDNFGNAAFSGNLSGVNITGNNSTLQGTLSVYGTLSAAGGNVIMNNDGLTINQGSINIGNGNGTTFSVQPNGTLLANNATITGDLTARKLTIASDADVSINVNGKFTVDNQGNVYASSMSLENGTISGSTIYGSDLHLGDQYHSELYDTDLYRSQYDTYGTRTGYTMRGIPMLYPKAKNGLGRIAENNWIIQAFDFTLQGYISKGDGSFHSSTSDFATDYVQVTENRPFNIWIKDTSLFTSMSSCNICFYDSSKNFISSASFNGVSSNTDKTIMNAPTNASYVRISVAFKNAGDYGNWWNASPVPFVAWQGTTGHMYTYFANNYNGTDTSKYRTSIDGVKGTYATIDATGLSDGDMIVIQSTINYDLAKSLPSTVMYFTVNGKSESDSDSYFASNNRRYMITGIYDYNWFFTYHEDLGDTITLDVNIDNLFYGGRCYFMSSKTILIPKDTTDTSINSYISKGYGTASINLASQTKVSSDGGLRHTYMREMNSMQDNSHGHYIRDAELSEGKLTLTYQNGFWNESNNNNNIPFSSVCLSGGGIGFMGSFQNTEDLDFAYPMSNTAISFWGNKSHEELASNGFNLFDGSGITMDSWGNIHLMASSNYWSVNTFGDASVAKFYNNGNWELGQSMTDKTPGIKFESNNGHITMGRLWLNTHGDGMGNNDVKFNLTNSSSYEYHSNVLSAPNFYSTSMRSSKTDISSVDDNDMLNAVLNTDIGKYHFKNIDYSTDSYRYTPIIEDTGLDEFSTDNIFIDDNGKALNVQNMIGALFGSVRALQKQISELNAKLLDHEVNNINS